MKLYEDLEEKRQEFLKRNADMGNKFEDEGINSLFDALNNLRESLEKCNDVTIPKFDKYKLKTGMTTEEKIEKDFLSTVRDPDFRISIRDKSKYTIDDKKLITEMYKKITQKKIIDKGDSNE